MKPSRISLAASIAIALVSSTAHADSFVPGPQRVEQSANRTRVVLTIDQAQRVERQLRSSEQRIAAAVIHLHPTAKARILADVGYGAELLRQRLAIYTEPDGVLSSYERRELDRLADAIAADLVKRYGAITNFDLLG